MSHTVHNLDLGYPRVSSKLRQDSPQGPDVTNIMLNLQPFVI